MRGFQWLAAGVLLVLAAAVMAMAQAPSPPCEEQLNNEMFQAGALKQQLAVTRAQLGAITKERDEAKAALAKLHPAKAPEQK